MIDLASLLRERLEGIAGLWEKDLAAHRPEELFSQASDTARSVADIAFETLIINQRVAARLKGEVPSPFDGFPPCPEELRSGPAMTAALKESVAQILESVGDPEREIVRPDGSKTTAFEMADFAAIHMYYHIGQVNYMQTVYGDAEIHWF